MISFGSKIIKVWIGTSIVPPDEVLWSLGAWVITSSIYAPLTMFLNGMGRIKIQAICGVMCTGFMLYTIVVLTRNFDLAGCAWAYGLAYTVPSIMVAGVITRGILIQNK